MPYRALDSVTAQAAPVTTLGAPLVNEGDTLADFRTELSDELGGRVGKDLSTTRANRWINWAYRHVSSMISVQELYGSLGITTVADQPFYALPRSVSYIKNAALTDETFYLEGGRPLEKIVESQYRKLDDEDDAPSSYFRYGRMLVLWPDPDNTYPIALDVKVRPSDMTADNHSPLLPTEFHEVILRAAVYRALRGTRQYQAAAAAWNDFLNILRPIENTDAAERGGMQAGVVPARSPRDTYRRTRRF